jgi:superfamily II DNA helicase RecQ
MMEYDYESGDDLLAGIDPDEFSRPKKRGAEADSDDSHVHESKRNKPSTTNGSPSGLVELARNILQQKFGYDGFRHEQEKAIEAIMKGDNALVIFPTGAGKSLCYQVRIELLNSD